MLHGLSPNDVATLLTSVVTAVVTLLGAKAMLMKTSAEIAEMRANQEKAHAETQAAMKTNHGSTSLGNAVDRLTDAVADVQADLRGVKGSVGSVRDDLRGFRGEVSDRVNELADRQTVHENSCPGRRPLPHAIHHPPNPADV